MSGVYEAAAANFAATLGDLGEPVTLKPAAGGEHTLTAWVFEHAPGKAPAEVPGFHRGENERWYTVRWLTPAGLLAVGQADDGRPSPAYRDELSFGGVTATVRVVHSVGRPTPLILAVHAVADVRGSR